MESESVRRNVILHMHLPKTGGTTLSAILDRELGQGHKKLSFFRSSASDMHVQWQDVGTKHQISDLEPKWTFGKNDLRRVLELEETASAISRHGMVIKPSDIDELERGPSRYRILPMFFLRRFFPWHASLYFQQRRDPEYMVRMSSDPDVIVAKTGTLTEYTRFCVDSKRDGHKPMFNWSESDVSEMMARIGLYHVGIMERYDESLVVMEVSLRRHFPRLDLSYGQPLNSRPDNGSMQIRTEPDLAKQIGADLAEGLHKIGMRSDSIHAKLNAELDLRIARISDFQDRLDAFKLRCKARIDAAGRS